MASTDLALRSDAIPFSASIWGYNRTEAGDNDITKAVSLGDLIYLANLGGPYVPQKDNYIRVLRPMYAQLVAAYLTLVIQPGTPEPFPSCRVSITKTTSESDLTVVPLTESQIIESHKQLAGTEAPFMNSLAGQPITVNKIDLTGLLPAYGSPDYRSDCFVIGIHFEQSPVSTNFKLYKFDVECSALIVK